MPEIDLPLVQGETFERELTFIDDDVPQSFAGFKILGEVRQRESSKSALALDLTPYISLLDEGFMLKLLIPATVTAGLDINLFKGRGAYWDLFLIDSNDPDTADRFLSGRVTLDPAVTRTVTA